MEEIGLKHFGALRQKFLHIPTDAKEITMQRLIKQTMETIIYQVETSVQASVQKAIEGGVDEQGAAKKAKEEIWFSSSFL